MRRSFSAYRALALSLGALAALAPAQGASASGDSIIVVEVDGLLDPVTAELIERSLDEAEREKVALFVLTMDSSVTVDVDVPALVERVRGARIPVAAWVKSGGATRGGAARVALAAHVTAVARDAVLAPDSAEVRGDIEAPTLRDLIAALDGREVTVAGRNETLRLGEVVGGGERARKQVLPIRFRELGIVDQAQHALTSPSVAYLLLVLGLCLVVFEFFAVGIGLAAAAGALLVLGAFVGLAHLPVNTVSIGLVAAGVLAVAVDVQAGRPRFWATVGTGLLVVGSLRLYGGPSRLDPPLWQVSLVIAGALVFLLPGLAALGRARFSTPTIGREWMVGEQGVAAVEFDPDGVVTVRGAPWRARATRASRIASGSAVRVVSIEGLVLEVEPVAEEHAARAP